MLHWNCAPLPTQRPNYCTISDSVSRLRKETLTQPRALVAGTVPAPRPWSWPVAMPRAAPPMASKRGLESHPHSRKLCPSLHMRTSHRPASLSPTIYGVRGLRPRGTKTLAPHTSSIRVLSKMERRHRTISQNFAILHHRTLMLHGRPARRHRPVAIIAGSVEFL